MTIASLKSRSHKDLAEMARQGGVHGWRSMRKDQLVKALVTAANSSKAAPGKKSAAPALRAPNAKPGQSRASTTRASGKRISAPSASKRTSAARATVSTTAARNGKRPAAAVRKAAAKPAPAPRKPTNPKVIKHLNQIRAKLNRSKNLATTPINKKTPAPLRDRLVVMVRDAFWLHVFWEITRQSVERAQAAMNQDWHSARPVLRVMEVSDSSTMSSTESLVSEIEIHGGVSNWYIHVEQPSRCYRLEIGYHGASGKFYGLCRSNVVTTPEPGSSDAIDENWTAVAENFDKIYALSGGYSPDGTSVELQELFEERLRRPMGSPMVTRYGVGVEGLFASPKHLRFEVDAELIIYGSAQSGTHVSLRGEPVRLRPDGSFTVRMALPNQRQVIPVVASAANGGEQRTIVLAIERNTKVMEPVLREQSE